MTPEPPTIPFLRNLAKRANLQVTIRSLYAARLARFQALTDILLLTTSLLLVVCTFMDPVFPPKYLRVSLEDFTLLTGLLGIANFAAALILLYTRPGPKAQNQRAARRHYTSILRETKRHLDEGSHVDTHELESRFLADDMFQDVPDRLFLCYKAKHVRKVELSKLLELGIKLSEAKRRLRAL